MAVHSAARRVSARRCLLKSERFLTALQISARVIYTSRSLKVSLVVPAMKLLVSATSAGAVSLKFPQQVEVPVPGARFGPEIGAPGAKITATALVSARAVDPPAR